MGFVLPPDDPRNPVTKSKKKSNVADGRNSADMEVGGDLVAFINRNVTPYPTEVGGPAFDLIPVEKQKDIMVNVARMHAQQEYDRIMALVAVLQQQAEAVKRRLQITDWVHAAKYSFQIYHGQCYWLAHDLRHGGTILVQTGPQDWTTGQPLDWDYVCRVKWLGDYTWVEVDNNGNHVV
jgi:hypothetical protein